MNFMENLERENNTTRTENNSKAYKSTLNENLDFFAQGGAMRNRSESDIMNLFLKAFRNDKLIALRTLFYLRDIRQGQGERTLFRTILTNLAVTNTDIVIKNMKHIPEYGRWDDLLCLLDTPAKAEVGKIIKQQLLLDLSLENPSLLAKWLPSINASSKETKSNARKIKNLLKLSESEYRKTLSLLRHRIDIVETKITEKRYCDIDYSKLPSGASMKYRQAFYRNDEQNYKQYIEDLKNNKTTINSKTLYPYEIVNKILGMDYYNEEMNNLYDAMWKSLPDYTEGKREESICVVDVSGSMYGRPMEVAISLGLYLAERNTNPEYKNKFITFSSCPQLVKIKGNTLYDKIKGIENSDWGGSTDLEAVFDLILKTAVKGNVKQKDMPKKLYIFSDMQFNQATKFNKTIFKRVTKKFKKEGYTVPNVVFWNVDAKMETFPCITDENGFQLVSGFSPTLFKNLLKDNFPDAVDLMLEVVNSERYARITI